MNPTVLVLNCGSSSLKGAVIDSMTGDVKLTCLAEKLNLSDAFITFKVNGEKEVYSLAEKPNHTGAIEVLMQELVKLSLEKNIAVVGHRVVHGGELFKQSTVINEEVMHNIEKCIALAPLHNPANLLGITVAQSVFADVSHVAVFDTSFHQTMPEHAYLYAIPRELYEELGFRRYGMHGTSYRYVAQVASKMLGKDSKTGNNKTSEDDLSLVIAHLGNGSSITAVKNGRSQDTSMGLTPLEGLIMGTRSGDIDPSVFSFLHDNKGMSIAEISDLLNKQSGVLGISGISNDFRVIEEAAAEGNRRAQLALEMFSYRLAKYVAAMAVAAGGIDALVFTGGIGENGHDIRAEVLKQLKFLGFEIDDELNAQMRFGKTGQISKSNQPVALVIPTNEELMIAQDAAKLAGLV